MQCDYCERTSGWKSFFCETCLNERLLIHNSSLKRLGETHEATISRASRLLHQPAGVEDQRILRARKASLICLNQNLDSRLNRLQDRLESGRLVLNSKTERLVRRRERLEEANRYLQQQLQRSTVSSLRASSANDAPPSSTTQDTSSRSTRLETINQNWDHILKSLMIVRRSLMEELLKIYPITSNNLPSSQNGNCSHTKLCETRDRDDYALDEDSDPDQGEDNPLNKVEWRILGFCLPVSTDIQLYHHEEVSAAALYTSHLLRLSAMYLGIKFPFQMFMGPMLSIRAPPMSLLSQKYQSLYPLYLVPTTMTLVSTSSGPSASYISFLTGLCMLAYNGLYLFSTQTPTRAIQPSGNMSINPRLKADELLKNLYQCLRSNECVGTLSNLTGRQRLRRVQFSNSTNHKVGYLGSELTGQDGFLNVSEFERFVCEVLGAERGRQRRRADEKKGMDEEWNIV
ncbi:hypothetical protein BY996DRAFT_7054146 [Phakopsora pachyrhizi]|nr:hypothetical protein BY996DRAFT_7054146 [Phakopsora pachyrhizi]